MDRLGIIACLVLVLFSHTRDDKLYMMA